MKFTTITEGAGYRYRPSDHGGANFLGVRCPACSHEFMPPISAICECPSCGFREDARGVQGGEVKR